MKRIFLLTLALSLTACTPNTSDRAASAETAILRVGNGAEPQGLDPHLITGVPESRILRSLFQGLVRLDPDTLEPLPAAALAWEVSDDMREYRFHLDPEARWSNGDPVTAKDFADSFQRILTPALAAPYASQLFVLRNARAWHEGKISDFKEVGVRVEDRYTLLLSLENPVPYFLSLLVNPPWFPLHRPSIEEAGEWSNRASSWTRPGNLISNGAYCLKEWRLNDYIRVIRNPRYSHSSRYHLNEIFFFPITGNYTEERAFLDGLLDVTSIVPAQRIRSYVEGDEPGVLKTDPDLGVYYLLLNTDVPPLDNVLVRQALSLSIDRMAISRDIRQRGEPPALHFTPPGISGYNPPALLETNRKKAASLLREAGYGEDRPLPTIQFLFNTSETHRPIAEALQSMWKETLAIDIELVNKEWNTYLTERRTKNFQIARAGWLGDYLDPDTFLGLWTSESTNNFTGWSDPEYDHLILEAKRLPDGPARRKNFAQAEKILLEEAIVIPIFFYNRAYLLAPSVHNWPTNILGYTDYSGIRIESKN